MIEFFREPDVQIGLNAFGLSRGQLLCIAMVAVGVGIGVVQKQMKLGLEHL
jgi:phosphatidylglycerol:prolipoprotein diacylglycerol transferase